MVNRDLRKLEEEKRIPFPAQCGGNSCSERDSYILTIRGGSPGLVPIYYQVIHEKFSATAPLLERRSES